MKNKYLLILICLTLSLGVFSQKSFLLGINPSVTLDKSYPRGAFDLNILPLVIELPVVHNLDVRVITLLNYGFRNYGSALINVGAELSFPYYIHRGEFKNEMKKGFFAGPGLAFSHNIFNNSDITTIFLEPGYSFVLDESFTLIIDLQYGRKFLNYDDGSSLTTNHYGFRVVLGWWFGGR